MGTFDYLFLSFHQQVTYRWSKKADFNVMILTANSFCTQTAVFL